MKDNKLIKLLIPLVSVVIIFESIMLVSNLKKGNNTVVDNTNVETNIATESADTKEVEASVADLTFTTKETEMKVGKNYKVELNLTGNKDFFIDGIENYIKYDSELVTISGLTSSPKLPKATISKVDIVNGIIENVVLVDKTEGFKIVKDEINQLLTFNVVPKKEGLITFEVSTGDKKFVTLIVETTTSKSLPFSANKLEINAIK